MHTLKINESFILSLNNHKHIHEDGCVSWWAPLGLELPVDATNLISCSSLMALVFALDQRNCPNPSLHTEVDVIKEPVAESNVDTVNDLD